MKKVLVILGYLEDEDIGWIIRVGSTRELPAGATLIAAGERFSELYILISGELSIHAGHTDEELVRRYPGEIIGELSFLDSRPPTESVKAATAASVVVIERTVLTLKLQDDRNFAARFYQSLGVLLASRFRQTMGQLNLKSGTSSLDESEDAEDELDPELLDHMALAGRRFELLLSHFLGRRSAG